MVNGGNHSEIQLADRVQRAERYVKAWRALEFSEETQIPFGGNLWEIAGGVVACTTSAGSGEISFTQLPSPLQAEDGYAGIRWAHPPHSFGPAVQAHVVV